jgi:hypothetical protein
MGDKVYQEGKSDREGEGTVGGKERWSKRVMEGSSNGRELTSRNPSILVLEA